MLIFGPLTFQNLSCYFFNTCVDKSPVTVLLRIHFMYRCMHLSCTLSCEHGECVSTYFVITVLFIFQNSDRILQKYEILNFTLEFG